MSKDNSVSEFVVSSVTNDKEIEKLTRLLFLIEYPEHSDWDMDTIHLQCPTTYCRSLASAIAILKAGYQLPPKPSTNREAMAKALEKIDEPYGDNWDSKGTPYKEMYLRRADQILSLIEPKVLSAIGVDALNEYAASKISFERCAEILGINYFELAEFCHRKSQATVNKNKGG